MKVELNSPLPPEPTVTITLTVTEARTAAHLVCVLEKKLPDSVCDYRTNGELKDFVEELRDQIGKQGISLTPEYERRKDRK
jgi:hypothetical protein